MEGLILHPSSPSLRTLGVRHVSRGGGGGRGEGGAGAVMGVLSTLELGAWAGRRDRQIEGYTFTHADVCAPFEKVRGGGSGVSALFLSQAGWRTDACRG